MEKELRRIFGRDVWGIIKLILGSGMILVFLFVFGALTSVAPELDELDVYTGVFVKREYESNLRGPGDSVLYFRDGAVYISHGLGFRGGVFDDLVEPGDELRVLVKPKRGLFSERLRGYAVYMGDTPVFSYDDAAASYAQDRKMYWMLAAGLTALFLLLAVLAWIAEWRGYNRICQEIEAARLQREEADRRCLRRKAFRHVLMTIAQEPGGSIILPKQILSEYGLSAEGWVILFTQSLGSFGVTRSRLISQTKFRALPEYRAELCNRTLPEGALVAFKGRKLGWLSVSPEGKITLSDEMLKAFGIQSGDALMLVKCGHAMFTLNTEAALLAKAGGKQE